MIIIVNSGKLHDYRSVIFIKVIPGGSLKEREQAASLFGNFMQVYDLV